MIPKEGGTNIKQDSFTYNRAIFHDFFDKKPDRIRQLKKELFNSQSNSMTIL